MTGFGDASAEVDGIHYAVELRSLNNRYFKFTVRIPEEISALEAELESLLRKKVTRGTIVLNASLKNTSASAAYQLNEAALSRYLQSIKDIQTQQASAGQNINLNVDIASMLQLPGVVQPPSGTDIVEQCRPVITELVIKACEKLTKMRECEGETLKTDLLSHRKIITEKLKIISSRAPMVVEEYHQRLQTRIDELMARAELKVNEVDLIREVAVFAERSDISEETQRLGAHMDQFEQIITNSAKPSGRTLDFLAQEMLREANTIASKSNDAEISRSVVELKGAIDRIKEQVQNVE